MSTPVDLTAYRTRRELVEAMDAYQDAAYRYAGQGYSAARYVAGLMDQIKEAMSTPPPPHAPASAVRRRAS